MFMANEAWSVIEYKTFHHFSSSSLAHLFSPASATGSSQPCCVLHTPLCGEDSTKCPLLTLQWAPALKFTHFSVLSLLAYSIAETNIL